MFVRVLSAIIFFLCVSVPSFAQETLNGVIRDSSGADFQVRAAAELLKRQAATLGKTIRTAALAGDNTAASVAYFKSLAEVLPKNDLRIVLNRVWTPPLTDVMQATVQHLVQQIAASKLPL